MARQEKIANSRNNAKRSSPVKSCSADFTLKIPKISAAFGGGFTTHIV
jgi:hypothetical protein